MFFKILKKMFDVKPYNEGYLSQEEGHKVYFMEVGNPKGKPVISFHGGPGYYARANSAKVFNLKKYRVIMFDQRGCGRSLPFAEMKNNTAANSVSDAKRILDFLNIKEKVIVYGGSWGSTLAVLFSEAYPEIVDKLIVTKVFLANEMNENWQVQTSGLFYPDILEKVKEGTEGHKDIMSYYAELINSSDIIKQIKAISLYGSYENVLGSLNPKIGFDNIDADTLGSMRIFINYTAKGLTLKDNEVMSKIGKIKDIETLIVHNRLDMVCPLKNAYDLHKALPKSKLVIAPYIGHSGIELSRVIKKSVREFLS